MTDEDIIRKCFNFAGFGSVNGPKNNGKNKPSWRWRSKVTSDVYDFELEILPLLGERRSMRVLETHELRRNYENAASGPNFRRIITSDSGGLLLNPASVPV